MMGIKMPVYWIKETTRWGQAQGAEGTERLDKVVVVFILMGERATNDSSQQVE